MTSYVGDRLPGIKDRSFFFHFIYLLFFWRLITIQLVLVLSYTDVNPPRVYMCSPSWTPLPLPTPSHPSGSSQCTSPEHPVSCIEPGLAILSHIIYMFQCHSPKPSHSLPLPQSPKDCSIHLCLFCCLAYRVIEGTGHLKFPVGQLLLGMVMMMVMMIDDDESNEILPLGSRELSMGVMWINNRCFPYETWYGG